MNFLVTNTVKLSVKFANLSPKLLKTNSDTYLFIKPLRFFGTNFFGKKQSKEKYDIAFNKNNNTNSFTVQSRFKSSTSSKNNNFISITWKSVIVTTMFGVALWLFMVKLRTEKEENLKRQRKQAIGKMAIGGPFELVDHNGNISKSSDYLGDWLFIYFGFTHCPDICPEEIDKMIRAVDLLDKVQIKNTKIKPIFVTVDPSRDDVKTVAKYIKDFSPKLIGLTGSKSQIEEITRAYRVYSSEGPKDEDNDYIVDHTVIMYLIDPEGNFVDYFGQNKTAEEIASAAAIHMSTFELGKSQKDKTEKS